MGRDREKEEFCVPVRECGEEGGRRRAHGRRYSYKKTKVRCISKLVVIRVPNVNEVFDIENGYI